MTLAIAIGGIDRAWAVVARRHRGRGRAAAPAGRGARRVATAAAFGRERTCAARTRMPPFIIKLATMMAERRGLRFTGAAPCRRDAETVFLALATRGCSASCRAGLIMLGAFALTGLLLHRTAFGQHLYAIGGNREAARDVGIPLVRRETAVYVICSLLADSPG
jgi:ribose/xylose/arabinose/galactoside ABC-type transport system permease subunit